MLSIETLLAMHRVSLLIEQQHILKIKYKIQFFNLACIMLILFTSFLFDFMRVATIDLALALTLRGCDLEYFTPYDQFPL
jgi:hypothetical protein